MSNKLLRYVEYLPIALFLITVFLYANLKSQTQRDARKHIAIVQNLEYRISESARIHNKLHGDTISFDDYKIKTKIEDIPELTDSNILLIRQDMCLACIEFALSRIQQLLSESQDELFIIGSYNSFREFVVLCRKFNIPETKIFYSPMIVSRLTGDEELPILINVSSEGSITKATFYDNYLPHEYYTRFIK